MTERHYIIKLTEELTVSGQSGKIIRNSNSSQWIDVELDGWKLNEGEVLYIELSHYDDDYELTTRVGPLQLFRNEGLDRYVTLVPPEVTCLPGVWKFSLELRYNIIEHADSAISYDSITSAIYQLSVVDSIMSATASNSFVKETELISAAKALADAILIGDSAPNIIKTAKEESLAAALASILPHEQAAANSAAAAESAMSDAQGSATAAQKAAESIKASADYLDSVKNGTVAVPKAVNDGTGKNIAEQFTDIEELIPSTTTPENQLTNEAFVNSSINNMAAFYITYNAGGDAFPTRASLLNASTYYYGGQPRTPTQNDYAIVLADESQPKDVDGNYPTTRYSYQGGNWAFQYVVNNTSLTQAQVDAINSGITAELVAKIGPGNVLSVNGETGAVQITPANIGAVNKSGDTMTGSLNVNGDVKSTGRVDAVAINLTYSTPFVDFHYNNVESEYSARLICDSPTNLTCKRDFSVEGIFRTQNQSNLLTSGNEFNFVYGYDGTAETLYINYKGAETPVAAYILCDGKGTGNKAGLYCKSVDVEDGVYDSGQRVYSPNNKPTYSRTLIGNYSGGDGTTVNIGSLAGYTFFEIVFSGVNSVQITTGMCFNGSGARFCCWYPQVGGIRGYKVSNTQLHIDDADGATTFAVYGIKI